MSEESAEIENEPPPEEIEEKTEPKKGGYLSKDEWEAAGNDPTKYVTEEGYNARGKEIARSRKLERKLEAANERIGRMEQSAITQDQLQRVALESQRETLITERDNAVDLADNARVTKIQDTISNIDKALDTPSVTPATTEAGPDVDVQKWNTDNPWITEQTPRADSAKAVYNRLVAAGGDTLDILEAVEASDKKYFSNVNPRSRAPRASEGGSPAGTVAKKTDTSFSTLGGDEANYLQKTGASLYPGSDTVTIAGKKVTGVDKKKLQGFVNKLRAES